MWSIRTRLSQAIFLWQAKILRNRVQQLFITLNCCFKQYSYHNATQKFTWQTHFAILQQRACLPQVSFQLWLYYNLLYKYSCLIGNLLEAATLSLSLTDTYRRESAICLQCQISLAASTCALIAVMFSWNQKNMKAFRHILLCVCPSLCVCVCIYIFPKTEGRERGKLI